MDFQTIQREAAEVDPITFILMKAARHGFTPEAEGLIKDGADVNGFDIRTEKTPLVLASENGHTETARLLIKYGADIEGVKDYYSPLASAAENGHTETVGMLIEKGANVNNIIYTSISILSLASKNGHNDTVKKLIQNGANVNVEEQEPALMLAVRNGHPDVARTLIEGGANLNYQECRGCSLLEMAIVLGKTDIAKLLITNGACVDGALLQAFEYKDRDIIKILTNQKIDIKQKDKYGNTFLILAAIGGEIGLMTDLIDKGSDINEKNNDGITALMNAALNGFVKAVEMLIEKGADVNKKAINGRTALMLASLNGCKDVIEKLIEHAASVNDTCQDGMTALMYACHKRRTDIVKLLIDKGADLNIQEKNGETALILATKGLQLENIKILIDRGADVSIRGKDGLAARSIAMRTNFDDMLTLLVEKKSIISQDHIKEHDAINLIDTDRKFPGKFVKINKNEICIKPQECDGNMSHILSTDIQQNANIYNTYLNEPTKENLGSTGPVKCGQESKSICEHHLKQPIHSSGNRAKKRTRQRNSLNQDKMYSKVASSHGLNFKRLKLASSHGSKVRGPKFPSSNVSKVRSPEDARSHMSNGRCKKCYLDTEPQSGESRFLPAQSAFLSNDSFNGVITDTTRTASTDITGKESTYIVNKISPYKINRTLSHKFQMEHSHHLATLLEEFLDKFRPKQKTNDVAKDNKMKDVQKTVELPDCSLNNTDNKVLSSEDFLSFNNVPNANTKHKQGAKNRSEDPMNQLVFNLYQIDHVDYAHLHNASIVNITDNTNCVIDGKTSNI